MYVDHPRYGDRPRVTGLNPSPMDAGVYLHWNTSSRQEVVYRFEALTGKNWPDGDFGQPSPRTNRIPYTAVVADLTRQTAATIHVTHYFDLERQCRDCKRAFIFFAEEQKYWYEELGFGLDSDCVRCVDCRKVKQGISRQRAIYESLFQMAEKDELQTLEMAEACLSLIEQEVFTTKQTQRVRRLLNSLPENSTSRTGSRYSAVVRRLLAVEESSGKPPHSTDRAPGTDSSQ